MYVAAGERSQDLLTVLKLLQKYQASKKYSDLPNKQPVLRGQGAQRSQDLPTVLK